MTLELRPGVKIESDVQRNDGASYLKTEIDSFRCNILQLHNWRQHTYHQTLMLDDLKLSSLSIDKVTQFGLRPPEFLKLFDALGNYCRWFHVSKAKISASQLPQKICTSLEECCWIDGLKRETRARQKALIEIM